MIGKQLLNRLDAAHCRHLDIKKDDVRTKNHRLGECIQAVLRLSDDKQ